MSTNIRIERVCQHCAKAFVAKTTVTKYCSHICNSRAYKAKSKNIKIDISNQETQVLKDAVQPSIKDKEFLTVADASKLLSCSERTLYRLINTGRIKAVNIAERKTLIKRSYIDNFFDQEAVTPAPETKKITKAFKVEQNYTIGEIQSKFNISEKALYDLIRRNDVPRQQRGKYVYVKKSIINKLLS